MNVIGYPNAEQRSGASDLVQGFGAGIPLDFACRQIVPKTMRVVYGPGVDPQTPINWIGGHPWAAVLREALRPTGLTLVPHGKLVEIKS